MDEHGNQVVLSLAGETGSRGGTQFGSSVPASGRVFPHPVALTFHLLFRVAAALTYLFCGWVTTSFITGFVAVVLLLSMDFWTTKNITGRLLAGLRWWNYVDDEGISHWVYESRRQQGGELGHGHMAAESASEARLFWAGLVASLVVWGFFLVATIFSLNLRWLMVVLVALSLSGDNFYGYLRCRIGAKQELSQADRSFLTGAAVRSMVSQFTGQDSGAAK